MLCQLQIKPKSLAVSRQTSCLNRDTPSFFLSPPPPPPLFSGVYAPHVYVRAWALVCFYSVILVPKLQALVYDVLPSANSVFSYAIGSRKLSANEQFFVSWCSNSSKFVTNNSNKTRRVIYSRQQSLHQHK